MARGRVDEGRLKRLGRRHFLAAGLACGLRPVARGDEASRAPSALPVSRFGKTGRDLPLLGFGGAGPIRREVVASF